MGFTSFLPFSPQPNLITIHTRKENQMPMSIADPAANVRKGSVAFFTVYEAWYRFNGSHWEFLA